jgi:hypothetical protein
VKLRFIYTPENFVIKKYRVSYAYFSQKGLHSKILCPRIFKKQNIPIVFKKRKKGRKHATELL